MTKTYNVYEFANGELEQHIGDIEADNIEEASKQALEQFLTPEQIEQITLLNSDIDREYYTVTILYYSKDGELLDNIDGLDEDEYNTISSEIGIELANEESD
jgi:hydrogenase maturation factor HypF (carbamoyltransferase family)